jgi:type IV secretion system protein VirB4
MSGHIGFGQHHFSVLCLGDELQEVEKNTALISSELVNCGVSPVRETMNLQAAYWAQLPANFGYIARKAVINTLNLSSFASLHNYPVGKKEGNHWGDAVTVFDTTSGTPYYFNFHVRDVGHTTIIGPTGAGKTVLMNFLCTQAQKFNARMFFFDKDRGADIFIRALGGNYIMIDPARETGFNPLQLPDTGETRSFLVDWFKSLVTANQEEFSVVDLEKINEAINGNFTLNQDDRTLTNILPFFGLEGGGSIANRIKIWTEKGSHGKLFDNAMDNIDFTQNQIFGFEMGELLRDKLSLGPVLLYLFHKIGMSLDGTPTMIILDEAWALIDNPFFAPKIKDWLKTLRKLNAMVVFATQSVEDASKSQISDTLIQQTATQN